MNSSVFQFSKLIGRYEVFNAFLFVFGSQQQQQKKERKNNNNDKTTETTNTTANKIQLSQPTNQTPNFKPYIKHSHIRHCVAYALRALTIHLLLLSELILIYG